MSKRINVTVSEKLAKLLEDWADQDGRSTSSLAAYLIERGVSEAIARGDFSPSSKDKNKSADWH